MLAYKLPSGVSSISVEGTMFQADEQGVIRVPLGTPGNVLDALVDPDRVGATPLGLAVAPIVQNEPEQIEIDADIRIPEDRRERNLLEKRILRAILAIHDPDTQIPGRVTMEFLQERAAVALAATYGGTVMMTGTSYAPLIPGDQGAPIPPS